MNDIASEIPKPRVVEPAVEVTPNKMDPFAETLINIYTSKSGAEVARLEYDEIENRIAETPDDVPFDLWENRGEGDPLARQAPEEAALAAQGLIRTLTNTIPFEDLPHVLGEGIIRGIKEWATHPSLEANQRIRLYRNALASITPPSPVPDP